MIFDYRGYGQSLFSHPSEARWRQDAEWALEYLTATRHVPAGAIVVDGSALGANLALEIAAAHPQLAGAVLQSPSSRMAASSALPITTTLQAFFLKPPLPTPRCRKMTYPPQNNRC